NLLNQWQGLSPNPNQGVGTSAIPQNSFTPTALHIERLINQARVANKFHFHKVDKQELSINNNLLGHNNRKITLMMIWTMTSNMMNQLESNLEGMNKEALEGEVEGVVGILKVET
ncbi:hypothetical protein A4A49_61336, partial [Nicotiana attenuata]